jgi:hypothetical protein
MQTHVARDADTSSTSGDYAQLMGHDGLFSALPDDAQTLLRRNLGQEDCDSLDKLTVPLMVSRYPREMFTDNHASLLAGWAIHGRPAYWLDLARNLCRLEQAWRQGRFVR